MIPSQAVPLKLLAAAALLLVADPARELRVLRFVPSEDASPTAAVTITFDRPVAGSLDRTVNPKGIFRIEPDLAGVVDWRDPVTLKFRPAVPLPANGSFTVTVSHRFAAMDGSRLAAPFVRTFRVRGSRVLAGAPVGPGTPGRYLTANSRFDLVLEAPVDSSVLGRSVHLEFDRRPVCHRRSSDCRRTRQRRGALDGG